MDMDNGRILRNNLNNTMSDTELKSFKKLVRAIWTSVLVNIILILSAVFYLGTLENRVSHLEKDEAQIIENMINKETWKYNDYFTRYLWAERWEQPLPEPPYNIRGKAPNM